MRRALVVGLLVLAAGCGGSGGRQTLAGSPAPAVVTTPTTATADNTGVPPVQEPAATQAPLQTASIAAPAPQPARTGKQPPDATVQPRPATVGANATAGTASSGPGRVSSPGPSSPSPHPTPTAVGGTVTVTDRDDGSTVRLNVGQHLHVRLSSGTWDPPTSSDSSVVARRSSTGGYPTDQPADATFDATAKGSASVSATSDAACFHTQPRCMMASRNWTVQVVVR